MSEKFQTIEIPIGGGLDQGKPERRVKVPKAIAARDLRLDKDGQYARALGYDDTAALATERTLVTGTDPDGGSQEETWPPTWPSESSVVSEDVPNCVFGQNGSIAQVTVNGLHVHDRNKDIWTQPSSDSIYGVEVDCYPAMNSSYITSNPDLAIGSKGTLALVWVARLGDPYNGSDDDEQVYIAFFDAVTMKQTRPAQKLPDDFQTEPRVVATTIGGNEWFTVAAQGPSGLRLQSFEADNSYAASTPVTISVGTATRHDMHALDAGAAGSFLIGYRNGAGTSRFRVYTADTLGTPVATYNWALSGAAGVAVYATGTHLYVAQYDNVGGYFVQRHTANFGSLASSSPTLGSFPLWVLDTRMYLRPAGEGKVGLYLSGNAGTCPAPKSRSNFRWGIWLVEMDETTLAVEDYKFSRNGSLMAAPVYSSDLGVDPRIPTTTATYSHQTGAAVELSSYTNEYPTATITRLYFDSNEIYRSATVARCFQNPSDPVSSTITPNNQVFDLAHHRCNTVMYNKEAYYAGTQVTKSLDGLSAGGLQVRGASRIMVVKFRGRSAEHRRCLATSRGTYVGGGTLGLYDGVQGCENSWHAPPIIHGGDSFVDLSGRGTSTMGSTADGEPYQGMRVIAVWYDAQGRKHRSAPSNAYVFDVLGNGGLNSSYIYYSMPDTANNDEVRGVHLEVYISPTYRSSGVPSPAAIQGEVGYIFRGIVRHQPTPAFATDRFVYHWINLSAGQGEATYDSTEVTSEGTLAPWDAVVVRDRMFYIPPTRDRVRFSKPYVDAYGYEFYDGFELVFSVDEGRLTALAGLDDKLVIFSEDGIHVYPVSSSMPDASGAGTVGLPRRIPSDVGCTMPRAVLPTSGGVYFASQRGLHMLDRNMQVQFLGDAAEDVLGVEIIRSAVLNPAENEARFYLGRSPTIELVHNYGRNEWVTREHPSLGDSGQFDLIDAWYDGEKVCVLFEDFTTSRERRFYGDTTKTGSDSQGYHPGGTSIMALQWRSGWIDLAGVAGFQRIKRMFLLTNSENFLDGEPYRVQLYYDYEETAFETLLIAQPGDVDLIRRHINKQKCAAFSVGIIQDSTGDNNQDTDFSIEGLQLEVAVKGTGLKKASAAVIGGGGGDG